MPTPTFKRLSIEQFEQLVAAFPFQRRITAVHMHHTWKPRRADFRGHETIVAMWRYHTQTNGWRDIAQHVTIAPDGGIWLGRNWNLAPASAAGHNGNAGFGPFMFEMVGDFDRGQDPFDGAQRDAAMRVIAAVQQRFDLATDTLRLHNMMSAKSCPGTAIDYDAVLAAVDAVKAAAAPRAAAAARGPFPDEPSALLAQAMRSLTREVSGAQEPGDAELSHDEHDDGFADAASDDGRPSAAPSAGAARDAGLTPAQIAALRPYLVNLTAGRFSSTGKATTTPADVDAIFDVHLPQALQQAGNAKLRIVFHAHGGLVSESNGLKIARKHVAWWRDNHVYPIHFVWETAFFAIVAQLLSASQRGRDLLGAVLDPVIERFVHVAGGVPVWSGMKGNAEHAADAPTANDPVGGGAHYVARKLAAFCHAHADRIELHAVGHSAGAVFHAWFLPAAAALGVPTFTSAHFMAPAIRVDTFKDRLAGGIGAGGIVRTLTVYTMLREFERDDNCAQIYRKSLLYLISKGLERDRNTPILGLEDSLRGDAELVDLFGLRRMASDRGDVVWSKSPGDSGRSASRATAHGDFDDDPPTMNSVLRRVLGADDDDPIVSFPAPRAVSAGERSWFSELDWYDPFPAWHAAPAPAPAHVSPPPPPPSAPLPTLPAPATVATGAKRALCIGIDAYPNPQHRLSGCVNDARRWSGTLARLGFETTLLVDGQATRAAIDQSLRTLVTTSRPGDVIALQYAGHGTHIDDLDGDEDDGQDEALCPVDFASGALYIDDDIAQVLALVPDGVNLTCFMDCCHSATNTRFAVGLARSRAPDAKPRYVEPTPELQAAHRRFRGGRAAAVAGSGGRERMRDIKFSACRDDEVALESGGNGEFTLRATRLLDRGIGGISNRQFLDQVIAAFGPGAAQNPILDCPDARRNAALLQPATRNADVSTAAAPAGDAGSDDAVHLLAQALALLTAR